MISPALASDPAFQRAGIGALALASVLLITALGAALGQHRTGASEPDATAAGASSAGLSRG